MITSRIYWSPDGNFIIGGYADGSIVLWDVERGHNIKTLKAHNTEIY